MIKNKLCNIDKKFLKITKIMLIVGLALAIGSSLTMSSLYGCKVISNDPLDTPSSIESLEVIKRAYIFITDSSI